jgi:hypothetical protein
VPGADEEQFQAWTWSWNHVSKLRAPCAGQISTANSSQVRPQYVSTSSNLKLTADFFPHIGRFNERRWFAIFCGIC